MNARRLTSIVFAPALLACQPDAPTEDLAGPSRHAYVWVGDMDEQDTDFLAVLDMWPESPTFGDVVATTPVGVTGIMAHHTELSLGAERLLFANGFSGDRTFVFDLTDARNPILVRELDPIDGYDHLHSFWRHPNGRVYATMQFGDEQAPGRPGGLAEFSADGELMRTASSADQAFPGAAIRTYALDGHADADRIVTTSSPMDDEVTANVVQVWRTSDLSLLHTVAVPVAVDSAHMYPFEVRVLASGDQALVNTWMCGFYLVDGITSDTPTIEQVLVLGSPRIEGCSVPAIIGDYWIMPVAMDHSIHVLDISDPRHPRVVFQLETEEDFSPHWVTVDPRGDRLLFSDGQVMPDDRVTPGLRLAHFDRRTGEITWDLGFTYADGQPGISFTRDAWPHGETGPGSPHGVVFGN